MNLQAKIISSQRFWTIIIFRINMNEFHSYSVSLNGNHFALMISKLPLLHRPLKPIDSLTWGSFSFFENEKLVLPWVQKRKITQMTQKIMNAVGIKFTSIDIFIIPSNTHDLNIDQAQSETSFIEQYLQALASNSIDALSIYAMPEHPNQYTEETTNTYQNLINLIEISQNKSKECITQLKTLCDSKFDKYEFSEDSIYPNTANFGVSIAYMKFLSYFRMILSKISSLQSLHSQLSLELDMFPYLIESFTLEFIPSFTHHHNSAEKLGDTALSLCIVSDLVRALISHPTHFLNHRYNLAISNNLFNAIGRHYSFSECIVGPIDEEKVPADCFEAISGHVFAKSGYDALHNFWKQSMFGIDEQFLQENRVVKTFEVMKLGVDINSIDMTPSDSIPQYAEKYIGSLVPPPKDTFVKKSDFQTKCKMIGASFLKCSLALCVFRRFKTSEDIKIIEQRACNDYVNQVAPNLGFPDGRMFKVFLGGMFLSNSFDSLFELMEKEFIPSFDLFPHHHRHHRHRRHHHNSDIT